MGPSTGPITTAMPKTEVTKPARRRGKLSSRMACDNGITGAPMPPCKILQKTSVSSESEAPQAQVAAVNPRMDHVMTVRRPKRETSQPVIGVTTAVARMLKVMAQAISSAVAPMVPCICGNNVEAISKVVEYRVEPRITAAMMNSRREGERARAVALSDMPGLSRS